MPRSDDDAISMSLALPLLENVVSTAILFRRAWTVKVKNVISVSQAREERGTVYCGGEDVCEQCMVLIYFFFIHFLCAESSKILISINHITQPQRTNNSWLLWLLLLLGLAESIIGETHLQSTCR